MALLVAVFGQHSVQKSLAPLQKQIGYWMTVAEDGERDQKFEEGLNEELKASARIGLGSRVAGWLAALLFISGVIVAGNGMADDANIKLKQINRQSETIKSNDR